MKKYKEGYELKEDEYLLKIRIEENGPDTGFMTKFNKTGKMPVAFKDWGVERRWIDGKYNIGDPLQIYVIKEEFRSGWRLDSWRFGKSMNWASLIHPEEFTVEIYLDKFLDIILENRVINGEIKGNFKWEYSKLIKK
jgi:hypothetical protein